MDDHYIRPVGLYRLRVLRLLRRRTREWNPPKAAASVCLFDPLYIVYLGDIPRHGDQQSILWFHLLLSSICLTNCHPYKYFEVSSHAIGRWNWILKCAHNRWIIGPTYWKQPFFMVSWSPDWKIHVYTFNVDPPFSFCLLFSSSRHNERRFC